MKCTVSFVLESMPRVCMVLLCAVGQGVASPALQSKPEEQAKRLVVMIDGDLDSAPVFGAGLVFARDGDGVLIATANHLVRRGPRQIEQLSVTFAGQPEMPLAGFLLSHFDPGLDLAVVRVTGLSAAGIDPCARGFDRLGRDIDLQRGHRVFHIGNPNSWAWAMPVEPAPVAQIGDDEIRFQSVFVAPGSSGGALLTQDFDVVGMVVSDAPPLASAKRIASVLSRLRAWGYPVHLYYDPPGQASPLETAIEAGDAAAVQRLVDGCAILNFGPDFLAPLTLAASLGNADIVKSLLDGGAVIEPGTLRQAAENGHLAVVDQLLKAGAEITPWDVNHALGHLPVLKRLLREDPELDPYLLSSLNHRAGDHEAAGEVLGVLLAYGWEVPAGGLLEAIRNQYWKAVGAVLRHGAADTNVYDADASNLYASMTPLQMAIDKGRFDIVRLLVEAGAQPNLRGKQAKPPWIMALDRELNSSRGEYVDIARFLLSVGGHDALDVGVSDEIVRNLQQLEKQACHKGRLDVLELLWRAPYPPASSWFHCVTDVLNKVGLDAAVVTARVLIDRGADIDAVDEYDSSGYPALLHASLNGQRELALLLIEAGANPEAVAGSHNTYRPIHIAANRGWVDVVQSLLRHGAEVDPLSSYGCTPLAVAAESGHQEVVALLLDKGAAPTPAYRDQRDSPCQPLAEAIKAEYVEIVKVLLEAGADRGADGNRAAIQWAGLQGGHRLAELLGIDVSKRPEPPKPVDIDQLKIPFH